MREPKNILCYAALLVALLACASNPQNVPAGTACATRDFAVVDDFPGARRGQCEILTRNKVRITIVPEDAAVTNPSPWYAFKLVPHSPTTALVEIDYAGKEHRYFPRISNDGSTWRRADSRHVKLDCTDSGACLNIPLGSGPVWVAAQELFVDANYEDWYAALSAHAYVRMSEIGRSVEGRPVIGISHETKARDIVLLVGRQHPPEVTGALAMRAFVDTVFADSKLAQDFRRRFRVIAIPLLNPDGVARGHWRHNAGGVDLNRDWGPFSQPETASIARLLDDLDGRGESLRLFLDFHSTTRNLFYTQMPGDITTLPGIAESWLGRASKRLEDYPFAHEPRPESDAPNGKQYMYERYGVPSMTYEVGDQTDRRKLESAARIFAEEMMHELLAH